ncbi:hypothetical protein AB8T21_18995, partial [Klebsiella pneumoniae]
CVEQDDKGRDARKRAYCLKIQPATGSFARNLIYSTKPTKRREKLIFMAEAIPALQQAGRMKIGQPFDVEIIGDE